jgi:prepilin peptidase CpaA
MTSLLAALLCSLLVFTVWTDCRRRIVPNYVPLGVMLLWIVAIATGQVRPSAPAVAVASVVLLIGVLMWRAGWLGGGDVKLIAALSLWAGPTHLDALLFGTALAGGGLALAAYTCAKLLESPAILYARAVAGQLLPPLAGTPGLMAWREQGLPYGVAVAVGGGWLVHRLLAA